MARHTPALLRALDVLEMIGQASAPLTTSEIIDRTDIPRTSAHEIVATLMARGYLRRTEGGAYQLGAQTYKLGQAYAHHFDMLQVSNDVARSLSSQCGETVSVALLEGSEVFYLAKAELDVQVPMASKIGHRLPANSTGLGKALLADLPAAVLRSLYPDPDNLPALTDKSIATLDELERELATIRKVGLAYEREESGAGIGCVAAQVRDVTGQVVAAISVSVPLARLDARPMEEWDALVLAGADRLSRALGYQAKR